MRKLAESASAALSLSEILKINDLCLSTNPRGTDKGSFKSYISCFYEQKFKSFKRKEDLSICEIGFRHGASLALWSHYFPNSDILGLDNSSDLALTPDRPVNNEWLDRPNIHFKIGDAYDAHFVNTIDQSFDIIIDDGPHTIKTQLKALELFLPRLRKSGLFIIEDISIGGFAILPLMMKVPVSMGVSFYDFRLRTWCVDDILFVVSNDPDQKVYRAVVQRLGLVCLFASYLLLEPAFRIFSRFKNGF